MQHFRGDYCAAALKSGAPLLPACTPPTLMDCIPVNRVKRHHQRQSVMSSLPAARLRPSHSAQSSTSELGDDVSLVSEDQVPVKRVEGFHWCQRVMFGLAGVMVEEVARFFDLRAGGQAQAAAGPPGEELGAALTPRMLLRSCREVCMLMRRKRTLCRQLHWVLIQYAQIKRCCWRAGLLPT